MKEFQSVVKEFILDRKNHMRYIAFLTVMCVIVSIAVPFSLIKPAISQTGELSCGIEEHTHNQDCYALICEDTFEQHEHTKECYQNICGFQEHIHTQECYTSIDEDTNDYVPLNEDNLGEESVQEEEQDNSFNNLFRGFTIVGTDVPSNEPPNGYADAVYFGDKINSISEESVNGNYKLSFSYQLDVNQVTPTKPTIYCKVSNNVQIHSEITGQVTCEAEEEFAGQPIANYTITTDGYIIITFYNSNGPKNRDRTEQYLDYHTRYDLNNDGIIDTDAISGSLKFDATINVGEDGKDYAVIYIGEKEYTIGNRYNLNVEKKTPTYDKQNKKLAYEVEISSTKGSGGDGTVITITDTLTNNANDMVSINKDSIKITKGGQAITGFTVSQDNNTINITGLPPLSAGEKYILTYDASVDTTSDSSISSIYVVNNVVVSNSGEETVSSNDTNYSNIDINYDITKSGTQLSNGNIQWTITVKNPFSDDLQGFKIKDTQLSNAIDGNLTYTNNVTGTLNSDTITLNSTTANEFTITYKTKPTDESVLYHGGTINNTAELQNSDNNKIKETLASVTYNSNINLNKTGTPNYANGEIDWTVTITNTNALDLSGFTLEDTIFNNITSIDNIDIESIDKSNLEFSDGVLKFKDDSNITATEIKIKYSTKVSDGHIYGTDSSSISNSATFKTDIPNDTQNWTAHNDVYYTPNFSLTKGNATVTDNKYNWTITINNPNGANLNGFSVEDTLTRNGVTTTTFSDNSTSNITVKDSSGNDMNYTKQNGKITLANDIYTNVTITYQTPVDTSNINGDSVSNSATLTGKNGASIGGGGTGIGNGSYSSGFSLDKFVSENQKDGVFTWTIIINNEHGRDLNGFIIEDTAFTSSMTLSSIKDNNNNDISTNNYSLTDGNLTFKDFSGSFPTSITITYITTVPDIEKYSKNYSESNTATLKSGDTTLATDNATANYNSGYSVVKDGTLDNINNKISWTITLNNEYERDLNGFYIVDTYLNNANTTNINVTGTTNYTKDGNKITFNKGCTAKEIKITYTTSNIGSLELVNGKIVNTVILYNPNNKEQSTSTKDFPYTLRNEVSKTQNGTVTKDTNNKSKLIIPWTVNLGQSIGGFNSLDYIDTLSTNGIDEIVHYFTNNQLENIVVKYKQSTTNDYTGILTKGTDYTISPTTTFDDKITGFNIHFTVSNSNVTDVQITYSSTAETSSIAMNSSYTFKNKAQVGDTFSEPIYIFTKKEAYKKYDAHDFSWLHNYEYTTSGGTDVGGGVKLDYSQPTTHVLSQLDTVDINGTIYYLLKYHIEVNKNSVYGSNEDINLTDTLPTNLSLYENSITFGFVSNGTGSRITYNYTPDNDVNKNLMYSINGQNINFKIPSSWHQGRFFYIDYSVKISQSNMNTLLSQQSGTNPEVIFSNSLTDGINGTITQQQTIQATILDKQGSQSSTDANDNYINYKIDFNLEKKNLSDGNYVNLVDTIYSDDAYFVSENGSDKITDWYDKGGFKATLNRIKVYKYREDGQYTSDDEITDFKVTLDNNPVRNGSGYAAYSAKITLEVPDETELHIEYTYRCDRTYSDSYYASGIAIFNKIRIENGYATQEVSTNKIYFLNQTNDAVASAGNTINIEKADVENYATKLSGAKFNLYQYSDGKWLPLTAMNSSNYEPTWGTNETDTPYILTTTSPNGKAGLPLLTKEVPYKLVEIEAPTDYLKSDDTYFFFYSKGTIPSGLNSSDFQLLYNNGKLTVYDSKIDTIDITANKSWSDSDTNSHTNDTATLELYSSYNKPITEPQTYTGTTDGAEWSYNESTHILEVKYNITASGNYNFTGIKNESILKDLIPISITCPSDTTVNNLWLSGIDMSTQTQKLSECTEIGFYTWNGDFRTITIQIAIKPEKIEYDKYGIPTDAEKVTIDGVTNPVIVNISNWTATWSNLPDRDENGLLYYYVKETQYTIGDTTYTVPDDPSGNINPYKPVYSNSGLNTTSTIEVSNTVPLSITVNKVWKDYQGNVITTNKSTSEVKIKLWQSTTKTDDSSIPTDKTLITKIGNFDVGTDGIVTLTDTFTYTYSGLETADETGNPYYYYVEENSVNGYTTSYTNNGISNKSGDITITNTEKSGSIRVAKDWYFYNSTTNEWEEGSAPTGISATFKIYRSTNEPNKPSGRYTIDTALKYGSNSISLDVDTIWNQIQSSTIESIKLTADTSLFSDDCAKTVTIVGQTIDISSGSGITSTGATITNDNPLIVNSESASAIKKIVIKYIDGQTLTINNTPTQVEKPAGQVISCTFVSNDNHILFKNVTDFEYKEVSKLDIFSINDLTSSYNMGAWVHKSDGNNTGWNNTFTTNIVTTGYSYTFSAEQLNVSNIADRKCYGIGISHINASSITQVIVTFTDGTTLTINATSDVNSTSYALINTNTYLANALGFNMVGNSEDTSNGYIDLTDVVLQSWKPDTVNESDLITTITLDGTTDRTETSAWEAIIDNLPLNDSNGSLYYYYAVEVDYPTTTVTPSYENDGITANENPDSIHIINYYQGEQTEMGITIKKEWVGTPTDSVSVKVYRTTTIVTDIATLTGEPYRTITLSSSNSWTYRISNLPLKDDTNIQYHYYVVEDVPAGYEASYSNNDFTNNNTVTITNTQKGSLTINKTWLDENGNTDTSKTGQITVDIYRQAKSTIDTTKEVKIMALGDSITAGYGVSDGGYPTKLQNLFTNNSLSNITVKNSGESQRSIMNISGNSENRTGIYEYVTNSSNQTFNITYNQPDIVLLQIGTNDMLSAYYDDTTNSTGKNIKDRLETLVNEIYNQKSDTVIFLASIPYFNVVNESNTSSAHSVDTWIKYSEYTGYVQNSDIPTREAFANGYIDRYNQDIKDLVTELQAEGREIYFSDINSVLSITDDTLWQDDGCHPSDQGYEKIAQYWYDTLNDYFTEPPTNITTSAPTSAEKVATITINNTDNWTKTIDNLDVIDTKGNTYVYYLTEHTIDGYTATYQNGIKLDTGNGTISIINSPYSEPTGSLQVIKSWDSSYTATKPTSIQVAVYQSTTEITQPSTNGDSGNTGSNGDSTAIEYKPNDSNRAILQINDNTATYSQNTITVKIPANHYDWISFTTSNNFVSSQKTLTIESVSATPDSIDLSRLKGNMRDWVADFDDTDKSSNGFWVYTSNEITLTIIVEENLGTQGEDESSSGKDNSSNAYEVNVEGATLYNTYTIYGNADWKYTIEKLPLADSDGNPYYYYVKEVLPENSPTGYIPIKYEGNGIQLSETSTSTVTITNASDGREILLTLPMTGGTGTTRYYLIGGTIVTFATVLLAKKHKHLKN